MTHKWFHIAKSEFLISTSKVRGKRRFVFSALLILAILWALYIAPTVISMLLAEFGSGLNFFLMAAFPGFMRSGMLFIWIMVLVVPLSNAMQEIKVSQWEIMLSHKVSTRDVIVGTFISRIPVYSLVTLLIAPVLLSPFTILYDVSLMGQVLMYLSLLLVILSTLWLSNFITTAIQAKLGESPRGNDLAKALTWLLAIILVIPMYGIMFFSQQLSRMLGMNIFLLFPFTWGADLITWSVILFNGAGLSPSTIAAFESVLGLSWSLDLLLLVAFSLFLLVLSLTFADRIFRIGTFGRTEKVVKAGKDGVFIRSIRRVAPGAFGIRLVTVLKDFTRKVQNVAGLLYAVLLTIFVPIILQTVSPDFDPIERLLTTSVVVGMIAAMMSGMTFGGIGFLDSQDQLWIIRSAPNGPMKYIKARIVEAFLLSIIIAAIPAMMLFLFVGFDFFEILVIFAYTYVSVCGGALVGTGIAANNPAYDDTKSSAFTSNRMITVLIIMATTEFWFIAEIFLIGFREPITMLVLSLAPLLAVGTLIAFIGARRISRPL